MTETVRINTSRPYDVIIGSGILDSCGEYLYDLLWGKRLAVVTDDIVAGLYLERVMKSLESSGFRVFSVVFPHGEGSKNMGVLAEILEELAEGGLTRADAVVALGGGVTGDMAGFAASVYQRGIPFAQIPTTLLAAVDSSVGGKTAVDLAAGKNLAGVFAQPVRVICDTDTFNTLPPEVFADGCAESIKYGVLTDPELFESFSRLDKSRLPELVARCVRIKGDYVERDEFDTGDRRFLNLGHTMGHAIEKLSSYTFPHGHAVGVGMVMIARAGEKLGLTEAGTAEAIAAALENNDLPVSSPYSPEELYSAAIGDKKRMGGKITVVIPEKIGSCSLKTMPVNELLELARLGKEGV